MFITLTQLHDEEATLLQPVISNKDGGLHVALRGFNYEVGYHNIRETFVFVLEPSEREYILLYSLAERSNTNTDVSPMLW